MEWLDMHDMYKHLFTEYAAVAADERCPVLACRDANVLSGDETRAMQPRSLQCQQTVSDNDQAPALRTHVERRQSRREDLECRDSPATTPDRGRYQRSVFSICSLRTFSVTGE